MKPIKEIKQVGKLAELLEAEPKEIKTLCTKHGEITSSHFLLKGMDAQCPACIMESMAQKSKQEAKKQIVESCDIPNDFVHATVNGYKAESKTEKLIKRKIVAYINNIEQNLKNGNGFMMLGNVGNGKTHLACALGMAMMKKTNRPFKYITAETYLAKVRETWSRAVVLTETEIEKTFVEVDLLILDEVGANVYTANQLASLTEMINKRSGNKKPTIIISNQTPEDLKETIGHRIYSRVLGGSYPIIFEGRDRRKDKYDPFEGVE